MAKRKHEKLTAKDHERIASLVLDSDCVHSIVAARFGINSNKVSKIVVAARRARQCA